MTTPTTQVHVAVDRDGVPVRAGSAYLTERRGVVSVVFDYDAGYLADRRGYPLSPDLSLTTGRHSVTGATCSYWTASTAASTAGLVTSAR